MTSIDVSDLTKRYGEHLAVDGISFSVAAGEVLGFLGPNGAGKSTTMKMITGFLPPTRGSVSVCGVEVLQEPVKAKARIGYLPEGAPLYSEMTPASFLSFIADIRGYGGQEKTRRLEEIAEQVQIREVWKQPIDTLSKGYKRRVALAQAIFHDPEVLILDEPTDGLDPNQKHEVRQLVKRMAQDKVIVISTHILEEVEALCNRAMIIDRGRILVDETPQKLETLSPRHNAVSLLADAAQAPAIAQALKNLQSVREVESTTEGSQVRLRALPRPGANPLQDCQSLLEGRSVEDLRQERGRLEEVFRHLTAAGGKA